MKYKLDSQINFYDHDIRVYEEILRHLKSDLETHHLPQIYFNNVGTILRREHLEAREFIATEFFVFIDPDLVSSIVHTTIPASLFICVFCNQFEREQEYTIRLLDEIHHNHYKIKGDCICEVILDSPVFEESRRDMFYRIQVPIAF